jgi:hypothetical protein
VYSSFFLDSGSCRLIVFTCQWTAFSSALILLSNIWSKGSGHRLDPADLKDLSRIHLCMRAMHAWASQRDSEPFYSRWDMLDNVDGDHRMSVVSETAYVSHYRDVQPRRSRLLSQIETFWPAFLSLVDFLYRHRGQHHRSLPHQIVRYVQRIYLASCQTCIFQSRCHHLKTLGIGWVGICSRSVIYHPAILAHCSLCADLHIIFRQGVPTDGFIPSHALPDHNRFRLEFGFNMAW